MLLKLFSVLKNKENKENKENRFGFQFDFVLKNIKNIEYTKFGEQEQFSRTVLKNKNQTSP